MRMIALTAMLAAFAAAPAAASELEEHCVAYTTETAGDPSGCSCLAEASDEAMAEELMAVASEEDVEALSEASKEAIAACWPESAEEAA